MLKLKCSSAKTVPKSIYDFFSAEISHLTETLTVSVSIILLLRVQEQVDLLVLFELELEFRPIVLE